MADMIDSDDSQCISLLRPPQWACPFLSLVDTLKKKLRQSSVGETYQELHKGHTVKHVNLTFQEKASNVMT